MAFPTKRSFQVGPFEFILRGYTFGHAIEVFAQFQHRRFQFILSRRQFTLEFRPG